MAGISQSLKAIEDLKQFSLSAIEILKGGLNLSDLGEAFALAKSGVALALEVKDVMPELQDLDANEVGQLGSASYAAVKAIIAAVATK